ncbi:hypothetical protein [Desulfurococcus amylolyticus]|uniref:hypothetical protein n=1 Tax=Desulfurococcus amylolyticus TaxID=94694 RepID=UPI000B06FCE2|nr:hypothetical protein [Desulfurococcus amylolyticus]
MKRLYELEKELILPTFIATISFGALFNSYSKVFYVDVSVDAPLAVCRRRLIIGCLLNIFRNYNFYWY